MRTDIITTDYGPITIKRNGVNYKLNPVHFGAVIYKDRIRMFISAGDVVFDEPLADVYVNGTQLTEENADEVMAEIHVSGGVGGAMMVPDYTNREDTNRISSTTAGASWTVDRTGFVVLAGGSSIIETCNWQINGKTVTIDASSYGKAAGVFAVTKGDVVTRAGDDLTGSGGYSCYFIPPKAVDTGFSWPALPNGVAIPVILPDYANAETVSRITASGGTWTADRSGWVKCAGNQGDTTPVIMYVNDVVVGRLNVSTSMNKDFITVFPVKTGDTVKIEGTSGVACYFIPPVYVNKTLPVVVEKNGSYSLDEIKTVDTWIDGKPIYKRTFEGSVSAAGNITLFTLPSGSVLVKNETLVSPADGSFWVNTIHVPNVEGAMLYYNEITGEVIMQVSSVSFGWGVRKYRTTVYYTKATDI